MHPQGRPKKERLIKEEPRIRQFSPRGRPGRPQELELGLEEFEAIRLADYQGATQEEAARSMGISQQTFSRIIKKARKNIAAGIVRGMIIRILPQKLSQ